MFSGLSYAYEGSGIRYESEAIHYLIDPTHEITIEGALNESNFAWQKNTQEVPSFGFSAHTYWFRFSVPASEYDWILELDYALLDQIDLYRISDGHLTESISTGDQQYFENRPIAHRAFLFPIPALDRPQDILLKVRSSSAIQLPLTLWPEKIFYEQDQFRFAEHGLYYGIVIVMALYNFFLFLRLRDSAYAFYVVYVIAFALTQLSLTGFAYQFLWPNFPEWNGRSIAVMTPLIVVAGLAFVADFLKLQSMHPILYRLIRVQVVVGLSFAILSLFLPYAMMVRCGAALAIFSCLFILMVSYYITIKGAHKYAIYFSAAWSFFLVGTVVLAMNKFGILPRTWMTESAAQIGSAIEIILLSFALAERLHDANKRQLLAETETLRISEQLVSTQRKQNEVLERKVEERTEDLLLALDKVKKLNKELSDLSTMDQVTGVRNRRYFDDMLMREFRRGMRNQSTLSLIMIDLDHFKSVNDNHGHLVGDLCLRTISKAIYDEVKRPPDLVCRYGGEELAVILPETSLEGAIMLAERIRQHIETLKIPSENGEVNITASLGVSSLIPSKDMASDNIISLADSALYEAKSNGRNQVKSNVFV